MKRMLASIVRPTVTRVALLLLLFWPSGCSKNQEAGAPPVAPNGVNGTKGVPSASGPLAPSQGAVTLKAGVSLTQFLNDNDLVLVTTLPMPAAGSFAAVWYYLVRTEDGSNFADKTGFASFQNQVQWYSENEDVWLSEDEIVAPDRDGLTFDDQHSRRTATDYLGQPAFAQVGLLEARTMSQGYGNVIAVLDTGVDTSHPLFQSPPATIQLGGNYSVMPPTGGSLESARNSLDEDEDSYTDDGVGHGTFVAGVIYTGARQATIRVYKVLNDEGRGTIFGLAKAIRAAALANVNVINLSLGCLDDNEMLHHVIVQAAEQGIVIVASAGNHNTDTPQYPACYPEVVSVAAVDAQDVKFSMGNYGSTVDIAAPGVDVISAIPSAYLPDRYGATSGTSAAAPWISAAVAVVKSARSVTAVQAVDVIEHDADDISSPNPGIPLGAGRLNMARAAGYEGPQP